MNPIQSRHRTMGELVTELKARLGFVAQGPASNNNDPVLKSFLQEGHDFIIAELDVIYGKKRTEILVEVGSILYDWHNDIEDEDIDPGLASALWIIDGTNRVKLVQGITELHRAETQRSYPTRYDTTNGQIELWPVPDREYSLAIDYQQLPARFAQDEDRSSVPDRLVLLYAISMGKSHYRHPDAQAAATTFTNMLRLAKVRRHENRRHVIAPHLQDTETVMVSNGNHQFMAR